MQEARASYTRYPRAILWLIRGGRVTIDGTERSIDAFYLSKSPITNVQYEAYDPAFERGASAAGDDDPAVGVDYHQALAYCAWYAGVSRKKMRLPTEAEWEYACGGDDSDILHAGNSGETIPPLRKTRPNARGLHAMLGGVWEWTLTGVLRGGSFRTSLADIGPAVRCAVDPGHRADDVGFRIARGLQDRD